MKRWIWIVLAAALLLSACGAKGPEPAAEAPVEVECGAPLAPPTEEAAEPERPVAEPVPPEEPSPWVMLDEPPTLVVRCGDRSQQAGCGSYSWMVAQEDGTCMGIEACGVWPLDWADMPALTAEEEELLLEFTAAPAAVQIRVWPGEWLGDSLERDGEAVQVYDETSPLPLLTLSALAAAGDGGDYILELHAEWPDQGDAYYCIRVTAA